MSRRSVDRAGLVWRADGDRLLWQPAFTWTAGLGLLCLMAIIASLSEGRPRTGLLLLAGAAAWVGLLARQARRAVVEVRLHSARRPTLTFYRADGRTVTYPLAELTRVKIVHERVVPAYGDSYEQSRMTLRISGHTLHTPYSTATIPAQLLAALAAHARITESQTSSIDPGPDFS